MCTVTYIPSQSNCFLTSSRDEKKIRLDALQPKWYSFKSGNILFAKDGNAGGTWMALHENGNTMVLLNGAFENHLYNPPYRKSRGLVFLDVFDTPFPVLEFERIDLSNIEPFTLVIKQKDVLIEARWNGKEKYITQLDELLPHIWSSATLYTPDVIEKRRKWFFEFVQKHTEFELENILQFHQFAGDGDAANDIRMNRNNELFTVSITALQQTNHQSVFSYLDLQNNKKTVTGHTHAYATV